MLKKFGMVTVGVTAGLLAVAPMASASDHGGDQDGTGNIQCSAESGDLNNDATGEGAIGVGQVAGPVASGNAGQIASCNSFLNENLNDNAVSVSLLGDALAGAADES